MRVNGALPRGFLRFLGLTALWAEGCGGGFAADLKKGARLRRGLCRRVVKGKVLKLDGSSAQGFLSLTGPLAPRVAVLPLCGNAYKVSVTGLALCVIWHEKQFC